MPRSRLLFLSFALFACKGDPATGISGVPAIVNPDRPEHYFDMPFPSDALLDGGGAPDLTGYPVFGSDLGAPVIEGWARRVEMTAQGFGNNTAAFFRFEDALELPSETDGLPTDPVLIIDLETGELLPLAVRFVGDPMGDPYYGENTLAFGPALGHPPRAGAQLAAVVMQSAGAAPAADWAAPSNVIDALTRAGVSGGVAVSTTYTVQDSTGQLRALFDDVDGRLGPAPDWSDVVAPRRVAALTHSQGTTPSGEASTVVTVTFEDGQTEETYLGPLDGDEGEHHIDMLNEWPMAVYQASVPVYNYSGLDDRPYMRAGFAHISDTERYSGWIDFTGGELQSEPDVEMMRVTISIPLGDDGAPIDNAPVVLYDHGTGGHAYNAVQRRNRHDLGVELATRFADAGWAVVGRDAPLYGQRYPLIDEGYGDSLGFYNIVNLPAFRDNQRQTAVEGHQTLRWMQTGLNDVLPAGSIDSGRVRRMGHSLGSVTANLGLAGDPDSYESALLSGTGGIFTHYFLDTGLIDGFDPVMLESLFQLFGAEAPDVITASAALGAALELPEESWVNIDRLHPSVTLFQWTMDPSDPMAVARDEDVPATVFIGIGDYQVPNFTSHGLAEALPQPTVVECTPLWDYDPHYCLHREVEGHEALADWLRTN